MLLPGRANENITFTKCSVSCEERCLHDCPQAELQREGKLCRLSLTGASISLRPYYLSSSSASLKMATLPKHAQWGVCAVAQPPADSCRVCTAVGGAQF